jgi:DNA mismatch repair protein MutS2
MERTLEVLEFDKVRQAVGECAASDLGRALIATGPIRTTSVEVRLDYERVAEVLALFDAHERPPMDGLSNVRPALARIETPGTFLEPEECVRIADLQHAGAILRQFIEKRQADLPRLWVVVEPFEPLPEFERECDRVFEPDASIKDTASPLLAELRAEQREVTAKIAKVLDHYLRSPKTQLYLQEQFITQRNYRTVLPIKIEYKNKVPGIVHDYSISEETAFIEPLEVVELSNRLLDLGKEEKKEIRRILVALADLLRRDLPAARDNVEICAELDAAYGKAEFALRHGCSIPTVTGSGGLRVVNGRHPLLLFSIHERCVPLTVELHESDRALVVSGPNAGGKTTAVKTLGVLALMVQCSIPIPAEESSVFPVYSGFFADIGDYQDLTGGVSTFTSHLGEVKRILERAGEDSLIILDELGTATDPSEGALLAQAILEEIAERGALALVTSHLPALKTIDRRYGWARTASFSLDPDTERPTYVLSMDVPGESNALKIARMIGLPQAIIERSLALMSPEERELKDVLGSMKAEQERLRRERALAEKERRAAAAEHDRVRAQLKQAQNEVAKLKTEALVARREALEERRRIVRDGRKRVEKMVAKLGSRDEVIAAKGQLADEATALDEELAGVGKELAELAPKPARRPLDEPREGLTVWVPSLNDQGTIVRVYGRGRYADVLVKNTPFKVAVAELELVEGGGEEVHPSRGHARRARDEQAPARRGGSTEINLIGKRVEDAQLELDRFVADAAADGYETVRVVHGYGTGALRQGVREQLRLDPHVKSFEDADLQGGGAAVTIAHLR